MIQFNLVHSNPAAIGWYKNGEKRWTHNYSYNTGIYLRRMGVFYRRNDYNTLVDAAVHGHLPTMFAMQSNAPICVSDGAFGIDMEIMVNGGSKPFDIGGNLVRNFIAELSIGDRWWNGTSWATQQDVFSLLTVGSESAYWKQESQPSSGPGKTFTTRDIDTKPESQHGTYIPVPNNLVLMGKIVFKLYVYDNFSTSAIITKCDVKFYPTEPEKENKDAYNYRYDSANSKANVKEVNLDICTKSKPTPGNNILFTNDGDYARIIYLYRGGENVVSGRIESLLLDRMAARYQTPQGMLRVTVKDDGTKWCYNEPVSYNGQLFALLAKKYKPIDNEITLTLQKL